jgi:nitrogen PTS system EIIA component
MTNEMMDLEELARYLRRDAREVHRLAKRGHLPGQKVAGKWRFARAEINHWLEMQMSGLTDEQLTDLEVGHAGEEHEPLLADLLSTDCMAVPLASSSRISILKELIRLAEQSWQVYDPTALFEAVQKREEMATTALEEGVAIPHPRRPQSSILGDSVVAYGRTAHPIPFGAPDGILTDIFFLVCCRDERTHLRILARLSRLFRQPDFLNNLRQAESVQESWHLIHDAEATCVSRSTPDELA